MEFSEILQLIKKEYYDFGAFKLPIPKTSFISEQNLYNNYIDILHNALFPNDYNVAYLEGPYEIPELKLKNGDVVIDAGANMGVFSAYAGSKKCIVKAFEPDYRCLEYLERVVKLNSGFNIEIITSALSNKSSIETLFFSDKCGGSTFMGGEHQFTVNETKEIKTITLDDYVVSANLYNVDFIKADIEGYEEELLMGGSKTLKYFKPKLSLCTYHKPNASEILEKIILDIEPKYNIIHRYSKIYGWCD
jgi:FkbM family methyltransferase